MKQERIRTGIKLYGFFPFMERMGNILEIKGMTGRGSRKAEGSFLRQMKSERGTWKNEL